MSAEPPVPIDIYALSDLPDYLKGIFCQTEVKASLKHSIRVLDIADIFQLPNRQQQLAYLLLRRHCLSEHISKAGVLHPPTLLQRARAYEALCYADLAAADAYVVYTLCEVVLSEEWVSDLEPRELSGGTWPESGDAEAALRLQIDALVILCRSLADLGATQDATEKLAELCRKLSALDEHKHAQVDESLVQSLIEDRPPKLYATDSNVISIANTMANRAITRFGMSRREIYPWNEHEPERNSETSIHELNSMLQRAAPDLEAKVTALPALDGSGTWHQLGLFARKGLKASTTILKEKSILTGIRPLDDALCDACGADLESISRNDMRQCPGDECDLTFCSEDCAERAASEYHKPNLAHEGGSSGSEQQVDDNDDDEEEEEEEEEENTDYPPRHAPFCGNTALQEIGRTSSTDTPEWDLYFLLLARTVQMATTQSIHPLDLPAIKYLWGDFTTTSPDSDLSSSITTTTTDQAQQIQTPPQTLPFSLYHNIALPLQFFETLMHSLPTLAPYTPHWLARYDWWIMQTLLAKFRGVANAQQSTYDGKPEIAAVHSLWCLANHSCAPNVEWTPTGVREFQVRSSTNRVWNDSELQASSSATAAASTADNNDHDHEWSGSEDIVIKKGDEIWSHYTDVRLAVDERRDRLKEVLGGICRCKRCLAESGEK